MHSLPFQEQDKILTLFSQERGVIKLFVKGRQLYPKALTEKLTVGEFLYTQGRSNLFQFCEGSVIEQHLHLRASWEALQWAEKFASALLSSQLEEKAAPPLYALFLTFLKKLPEEGLWAPFLLKILKHEGIFQLEPRCTECCKTVAGYRYGGQRYCRACAPKEALEMGEEEEKSLRRLFQERSFEGLLATPLPQAFVAKVETLFSQVYSR